MKLIVTIPAYNEEANIAEVIAEVPRFIAGIASVEVLVVDDGSTDQTSALAREAARSGLPVITVYPTIPVGPGDRAMTAPTRMVLDLLRGDTPAMLEARLNFIAVEDAARGTILAAGKGAPGGRYILGGQNMTIGEFLALLGDVSGHQMPARRIPWWLAALSARVMELGAAVTGNAPRASVEGVRLAKHQSFVDTARARSDLGFEAGSVGEALRRQIAWFEAEGHL